MPSNLDQDQRNDLGRAAALIERALIHRGKLAGIQIELADGSGVNIVPDGTTVDSRPYYLVRERPFGVSLPEEEGTPLLDTLRRFRLGSAS